MSKKAVKECAPPTRGCRSRLPRRQISTQCKKPKGSWSKRFVGTQVLDWVIVRCFCSIDLPCLAATWPVWSFQSLRLQEDSGKNQSWLHVELPTMFFPTSLCGVRVFDSASRPSSRPPPVVPPPALHTHNLLTHNLLTHNLLTHTQLAHTHTQLAHTQLAHTQLAHTQLTHTQLAHTHSLLTHNLLTHSLLTHNLLTHNLLTQNLHTHNLLIYNLLTYNLLTHNLLTHTAYSHTTCTHTQLAHTQLTHTQLAHTQLTHTQLAHTQLAHTQLAHTQLTHTQFVLGRRGTWRHASSFHVADTQLAHTELAHTQLDHTQTYSHTTCSHTTYSHTTYSHTTCTHTITHAGVALGDMDRHFAWQAWHIWHSAGSGGALGSHVPRWSPRLFAWQAWHLETSIFVLRGRRGTWWHPPSFHVAGVVLDLLTHNLFTHNLLTHNLLTHNLHTYNYSRRRGTWRHGSSLCVAGVARMALGWLWWRARFPRAHVVAAAFCVAGVALGDIHLRFTWQAWYLVTSTFVSRGRRGTRLTHTQLVHTQLTHTHNLLTHNLHTYNLLTQAWHLATWIVTLRGRRGTYGTGLALVARSVPTCSAGRRGFLRGRRGTWRHPSSFHVAGVVLGDIHLRFTWQAWYSTYSHTTCSHTTYSHATYSRTTCTHTITHAGVALGDMDRHLAWQAWHVWHWAGSGGALGSHVPRWSPRLFAWQAWHLETSIFVSRGRRGTWWHPPSFHVAGVVLDLLTHNLFIHNLLTRNLLTHNLHTYNYSRRRGTWRHGSSLCVAGVARMALGWLWWRARFPRAHVVAAAFCVAGVALGDIHLRFTWQAWYLVTSTFVSRGRRGTRLTHTQLVHTQLTHTQLTHTQLAHIQLTPAGVALGDSGTWTHNLSRVSRGNFAWQARGTLWHPHSRGTLRHPPWFHAAGVVLGHIDFHFAWQAWRLWHWVALTCHALTCHELRQQWYLIPSTKLAHFTRHFRHAVRRSERIGKRTWWHRTQSWHAMRGIRHS